MTSQEKLVAHILHEAEEKENILVRGFIIYNSLNMQGLTSFVERADLARSWIPWQVL